MDVDGPGPSADITFSAEATKGKRSAANLPVEAEDTLPWYGRSFTCSLDQGSLLTVAVSGLKSTDQ